MEGKRKSEGLEAWEGLDELFLEDGGGHMVSLRGNAGPDTGKKYDPYWPSTKKCNHEEMNSTQT